MNSIIIDLAFVVLAVVLCIQGWRQGFVKMAGSLLALGVSVIIATWGVAWIENVTGWHFSGNPVVYILIFLFVTLVLTKLMGIVITLLDLVRKIFSIIPGIGTVNSALGFAVGVIETGMVAMALAFATVNFFPASEARNVIVGSQTVSTAINVLVKLNIL